METTKEKITTKCYMLAGLAFILLLCGFGLGLKNSALKSDIKTKQLEMAAVTYSNEVLAAEKKELLAANYTLYQNVEKLREFGLELREEVTLLSANYDKLKSEHETLKGEATKHNKRFLGISLKRDISLGVPFPSLFKKKDETKTEEVAKSDTEVEPTKKKSKLSRILPWNWFRKKK
jgi:hypothetical protein